MTDREYLEQTHIARLQSAARVAGLRWKSGTPGYDKAGIITRLEYSPSIMRATIAQLKRSDWTGDPKTPKPAPVSDFLSDIEAETRERSEHAEPSRVEPETPHATDALISGLSGRVDRLESYAISAQTAGGIARDHVKAALAPIAQAVADASERLTARLDALETSRPVQIHIGPITLPTISGQHERFPRMAKWLSLRLKGEDGSIKSRTHVLLIGPAGTGKTTAAVAFARMMNLELYAQPLTIDAFGVTGFISPTGEIIETEFSRAWKNGGVLLWDELSMSAKDAIGALNSALANGFIALPGVGNIAAHPDFYFIAGDNSDTGASALFSARELLDGATLDRFIRLDWPVDLTLEKSLVCGHTLWLEAVRAIRAFIAQRDIQHVGATSRAVIMGAQALQAGCFTRVEILEDTCRKGVLIESWPQVLKLPAVSAFLQE